MFFTGVAAMSDDARESQDYAMAGKTLERVAIGGVLFAMVVFGLFKDLLG
jgi:hypothetical protein